MKLLGSMTLSGSVVMLVYIILNPVLKRFFSAKCRYLILIISMFFYLAPVQLGRDFKLNLSSRYLLFTDQGGNKVYDVTGDVIQMTQIGEIYFPYMRAKITLFVVWGIIAATVICRGLLVYYRQRKMLLKAGRDITDRETLTALEATRTGMGIRRKIMYRWNSYVETPLSVGVLRPILLLPDQRYHDIDTDFIYEHELLHIKNNDTLFKLLGLWGLGINWYNPLTHFLFRELNKVSENVCDEQIALHCGKEQRIKYAYLILEMSVEDNRNNLMYAAFFSRSKENVKERISLMMKTKKMQTGVKILAVCLIVGISLAGSIPVLAYKKPVVVWSENIDPVKPGTQVEEFYMDEGFEVQKDEMSSLYMDAGKVSMEKLPAERYFQDQQGNLYIDEDQMARIACSHTYVNGTYNKHEKNGDSCTVYVYNARRCSKCGSIITDSLAQKIIFPKCPH